MESATKTKPVTVSQIAHLAGVSPSAVSSFVNNRDYGIRISVETQNRILEACRKLNYHPKNAAALARIYPELGELCFLLNSTTPGGTQHEYFGQMFSGIVSSLKDPTQHVAYSLYDPDIDYLKEPERLPQTLRLGAATKFIAASTPNLSLVETTLQQGHPFVYLGHYMELPGLCCIVPDYQNAMRQAVAYLNGLGHRQIGFVTGSFTKKTYNQDQLERGFAVGMEECGLPLRPNLIYYSDFSTADLVAATDFFLAQTPRPTAILCFHDPAALVVAGRLQTLGLRVPHDISVMGCNDEHSAATYHPAITTVHFPLQEMGRRAVSEIEKQLTVGRSSEPVKIELPVHVVERASCAPPAV